MVIVSSFKELYYMLKRPEFFSKESPTFEALVDEEFRHQKEIIGICLLSTGGFDFVIDVTKNSKQQREVEHRMEVEKSQVRGFLNKYC